MENTQKGKIIKGVGGLYTVRLAGGDTVACRARGSFRHDGITLLAGDNVLIQPISSEEQRGGKSDGGEWVISEILDRRNSLIRPPLANLDYIFITMAAAHPTPILTTIDKLISIAEFNRIEPIVVITKRDIAPERAEELCGIYKSSGFEVFCVSSSEGDGVDALRRFIDENMADKTAAFAGASGVGKSTLMNALFPTLELSTSEISRKIERGRHTTRLVELFPISEDSDRGYIADTPGFSMLDFERFDFFSLDDLPLTVREFEQYIGQCKYTKCSHTKEEGCAIVEAVKRGDIQRSRHESFLEIYATLKAKKKW